MKREKNENIIAYRRDAEFFFMIGMKYADRKNFINALKYTKKAVEIEPLNPDYQFNLGCILAELKDTMESNRVLLDIIRYIDPTLTECYFGIGCNYFDLGDFVKSREYFEKYIYFDPEGQFVEEAHDILYYLQIYDDVGQSAKNTKTISRLLSEGKRLVSEKNFSKACSKLEKALELDPENIPVRIELSLAYYFAGNMEKAICLSNTVLRIEPQNMTANCNLALYYFSDGKRPLYRNQLKELLKLKITSQEDFRILLDRLAGFNDFNSLSKIINRYIEDKDSAKRILQSIQQEISNGRELGSFFKELWDSNGLKAKIMDIKKEVPCYLYEIGNKAIGWRKEWQAVIDCAMEKREFDYKITYRDELKNIWMSFIRKVYPEKMPVIKKREIWAATLEYIYCNAHFISISKKKLAEKYHISPASITNRLKDFW